MSGNHPKSDQFLTVLQCFLTAAFPPDVKDIKDVGSM